MVLPFQQVFTQAIHEYNMGVYGIGKFFDQDFSNSVKDERTESHHILLKFFR
ncbi:hypothetical protein CLDAP_11910 [Caldilinea aerophila DSM 14535 = NBRC 104270]|uniref:Uncharacterized protein n=1 Tax=Caldilinea aerophila (strain DSM 14535 / JCM 11387 / NBRC 104270 / STL-6-O1) TaxID=926550 RepID=I0I1U3_CALAS|nr:hypothetical protein CLDAP_11910 [Caldilinea aerophila DSM 14535 = NBRC 104270]